MGLVNDVLLDLERRGASTELGRGEGAAELRAAVHEHGMRKRLALRLGAVAGALAALWLALVEIRGSAPRESELAAPIADVSAAPVAPLVVAALPPEPRSVARSSAPTPARTRTSSKPKPVEPVASAPLTVVEVPPPAPDFGPEPPVPTVAESATQGVSLESSETPIAAAKHEAPNELAELARALERDPLDSDTRVALAGALVRSARSAEARALVSQGLALAPEHPALRDAELRFLIAEGSLDAARERLRAQLALRADDPELQAVLAGVELRDRKPERALELYQSALRSAPDRAAWWLGLGLALELSQRRGDAEVAFATALGTPGLDPASQRFASEHLRSLGARQLR